MLQLLRKTIKGPINHVFHFLSDRDYRCWTNLETKYRLYPRFKEFTTIVNGLKLVIPDSLSFLSAYKDIFRDKTYRFKTSSRKPYVVDIGSNIGISVLFFKKYFPGAEIVAVEADPQIFKFLEINVHGNGYKDIKLINKAAWHENTTLKFSSEGADAGRIAYDGDTNIISVEAFDINQLIVNKSVDLLKIDIEGAEENVLRACKNNLQYVNNIIVEYHSKVNVPQHLADILTILREAGFRTHLHTITPSPNPLIKINTHYGFDQQINIFAWRASK